MALHFKNIQKSGITSFMRCSYVGGNHLPTSSQRLMSSQIDTKFAEAKERINTLKNEPGNDVKLKLYALFKQATIGANTTQKPSAFNFVGQAKWNAWHELKEMTVDDAKQEYANVINQLAEKEGHSVDSKPTTEADNAEFKTLLVTRQDNITKIVLNRPKKKNALTREMYEEIIVALNAAAKDDSTLALITGAGDYFCSGNDLGNFMSITPDQMQQVSIESGDLLRRYVAAYIDFPKPLIAAINGPAIGISVTILGLFDLVYAAEHASFLTPFSNLGQSPEGCSSYTFPKIMGHTKACEMLLFNKKLTAAEGKEYGLVTTVLPTANFESEVMKVVKEMATLPVKSLVYSKTLMRAQDLETLHQVNKDECDRLVERWTSEDCINAIMKFFQQKNKL